jgi:hypothetical protein
VEDPHVPERDGQIDLPEGERLDSKYDPMEWRRQQPQRGPWGAHLVKRGRVEHVDPAAPSIRTLWILLDLNRRSTTSGLDPG